MLAPMQYRDFVWPNNPRVFEVEYRRTLHSYKLPFSGYVVQNLGLQNKIIRGEGEFVGPKAYESFRRLAALFEENKGGKLVHPVWPTMRAYFAKLSLRQEPKEDYISYSFEFWEYVGSAFHGVGEADSVINVGVSGPGVVYHALQKCKGAPFDVVAETIKKTAFQITRMGQMVAAEASDRLNVPFGIVDLSLAPTPAVGDSVARILEEMGLETCGTHGTTAALALLNDAVKKGGIMASGHVGGLSGAFIPVSEDEGMIAAAECGTLTIDKLEAMTCVCSVGLDMIAVPGDTSAETISAIIADEAAIGMVNSKTTAVRIIPVEGKDVGDMVEMGGLLGSAPVMPVHKAQSADFIARGGRIPAPLQSLKN